MLLRVFHYILVFEVVVGQVVYDAFFGRPLTDSRRDQLMLQGNGINIPQFNIPGSNSTLSSLDPLSRCTITVQTCRKDEYRRVDGTCVNPRYPSRGGSPTPLLRMLPPKYGIGNTLRPAKNGSMLPSARLLRTKILADGYLEDHKWSTLASHVFVFSIVDLVDLTYLLSYSAVSDCCLGNTPNRINPTCIPIEVPQDDPYLRQSGIRCMNLTRIFTFQQLGCIPNSLPAERYSYPTPLSDLSVIYGSSNQRERQVRLFEGGLLRFEVRDGVERPPGNLPICYRNRQPVENACYDYGDPYDGNLLSGIYLTAMWFYREHNRLARNLAKTNPCWDDQKLFDVARQINIAQWLKMLYYELLAPMLGWKNAIKANIIYETEDFVNDFDEDYKPGVFHEYTIGTRWFHTLQDGRTDLYSNSGKYLGTRTAVNDAVRSGILEVNNTEADLTQGSFRQPSAKFDYTIEPDMAERVLGEVQSAADLAAIDIMRGRDVGLPSYNEYRKICGLPYAHDWEDLGDWIKPDKLEQMKRIYGDVHDVDLMLAIYAEKKIEDSVMGPVLFCIIAQNLIQWRKSDRYWFEHGDHPTALTLSQLHEIKKTSVARLLCDNGNRVDRIQPKAFFNTHIKGNEIVSCKKIPGIDLKKWEDPKCYPDKEEYIKKEENENKEEKSWKHKGDWVFYGKK